jgi:hypothetical protein
VDLYDWLLFLHVLSAFALVAATVCLGAVQLGGGEPVRRVLAAPAVALWNAGGLGVLVFGVWLALHVDAYEVWDGWIIAAIVLWFVGSAAGGPLSRGARDPSAAVAPQRARLLLTVMSVSTLLILIDMVFKPGA